MQKKVQMIFAVCFATVFVLMAGNLVLFQWLASEQVVSLFRKPGGAVLNLAAIGLLLAVAWRPRLTKLTAKLGEVGQIVSIVERTCAAALALILIIAMIIIFTRDLR